jgi:hypothetical protein
MRVKISPSPEQQISRSGVRYQSVPDWNITHAHNHGILGGDDPYAVALAAVLLLKARSELCLALTAKTPLCVPSTPRIGVLMNIIGSGLV